MKHRGYEYEFDRGFTHNGGEVRCQMALHLIHLPMPRN